jgi:hypothetical protein
MKNRSLNRIRENARFNQTSGSAAATPGCLDHSSTIYSIDNPVTIGALIIAHSSRISLPIFVWWQSELFF